MKKWLPLLIGAGLVVVLLIWFFPSKDICSDEVRGYETAAKASLDAARESLISLKASLGNEESQKVPSQIDGLTATNFAALKACDTQCKILGRCLRFVYLKSPSDACPTEYKDYKARVNSALELLAGLQRLDTVAKKAAPKAQALKKARQEVKELERSSGSVGSRLEILKERAQQLEADLDPDLLAIQSESKAILGEQS